MTFQQSVWIEFLRTGTEIFVLLITWGIGQKILVSWDARKKRQELDIMASGDFNKVYGNFKEVSKLWRILVRNDRRQLATPEDARWNLLMRACEVESQNE